MGTSPHSFNRSSSVPSASITTSTSDPSFSPCSIHGLVTRSTLSDALEPSIVNRVPSARSVVRAMAHHVWPCAAATINAAGSAASSAGASSKTSNDDPLCVHFSRARTTRLSFATTSAFFGRKPSRSAKVWSVTLESR